MGKETALKFLLLQRLWAHQNESQHSPYQQIASSLQVRRLGASYMISWTENNQDQKYQLSADEVNLYSQSGKDKASEESLETRKQNIRVADLVIHKMLESVRSKYDDKPAEGWALKLKLDIGRTLFILLLCWIPFAMGLELNWPVALSLSLLAALDVYSNFRQFLIGGVIVFCAQAGFPLTGIFIGLSNLVLLLLDPNPYWRKSGAALLISAISYSLWMVPISHVLGLLTQFPSMVFFSASLVIIVMRLSYGTHRQRFSIVYASIAAALYIEQGATVAIIVTILALIELVLFPVWLKYSLLSNVATIQSTVRHR